MNLLCSAPADFFSFYVLKLFALQVIFKVAEPRDQDASSPVIGKTKPGRVKMVNIIGSLVDDKILICR